MISHLLTDVVRVESQSVGDVDAYGNPLKSWAGTGEVPALLQQRAAREVTRDRDTIVSDWILWLEPTVVLTGRDLVVDAYGRTFEVVGAPDMTSAPHGVADHIEVALRHVDG